ncbi:MAG: hypothetical protein PHP82_02070 [Candidatus ainarchaeum sp.]|nr:hypothetical protein [Candidatus ainarchaeum sp.]
MNYIKDFERKFIEKKHLSIFRFGIWTIFHSISIFLISQLILLLNINNFWIAWIIFGVLMTLISGLIGLVGYDRKIKADKNFLYFIITHMVALLAMNVIIVPLSGFTAVPIKLLITGLGVSFVARVAKREIMKKVIWASVILTIAVHLPLSGEYLQLFDLVIFLIVAYIVLMLTWLALKYINSFSMHSDLTNWGLRILGGLIGTFGIFSLMFSSFVSLFAFATKFNSWMLNLPLLISLCIIIIGAFMAFRSNRRYPMIGVW